MSMQRMKALTGAKKAAAGASTAELHAAIEEMRVTIGRPVKAPAWSKSTVTSGSAGIPLLFFSDAQWGEYVSSGEMDGVNSYDESVAQRRYAELIDTMCALCTKHIRSKRLPGMYYMRGGDNISGEIHDELMATNDLSSVRAVRSLVAAELRGIKQLVKTFGKVHVISVPGNHGRLTQKKYSKEYAYRNFDTLSAWWLESAIREIPALAKHVTFCTPESGDAVFNLYGKNYLLTHGDRIGTKSGSLVSLNAGMKRCVDYYAALGVVLEKVFIGHYHNSLELEWGWVNGCLPGITEYARDLRMKPRPPSQWMFMVHPVHGITVRWPIQLTK